MRSVARWENIDRTFIQTKMLNMSKGPAVHSLRAQADKKNYSNSMRRVLENTDNLTIKQGEVAQVLVEDGKVAGLRQLLMQFTLAMLLSCVREHI